MQSLRADRSHGQQERGMDVLWLQISSYKASRIILSKFLKLLCLAVGLLSGVAFRASGVGSVWGFCARDTEREREWITKMSLFTAAVCVSFRFCIIFQWKPPAVIHLSARHFLIQFFHYHHRYWSQLFFPCLIFNFSSSANHYLNTILVIHQFCCPHLLR